MRTSNKPALLLFTVRFTVPNPLSAIIVMLVQLLEVVRNTKPSIVSSICLLHKTTVYVNVSLLAQLRACKMSIRVETESEIVIIRVEHQYLKGDVDD